MFQNLKLGKVVQIPLDLVQYQPYLPNKRATALYTCVVKGNKRENGFWQPGRLNMTSKFKLDYLLIDVPIDYMVWAFLAASKVTTASEVISDLIFKISDPNYLLFHMHLQHLLIW